MNIGTSPLNDGDGEVKNGYQSRQKKKEIKKVPRYKFVKLLLPKFKYGKLWVVKVVS